MSQKDKAESRTQRAHELSHAVKRTKPHRAVIKGRKVAKKHAAKAQRRVDKEEAKSVQAPVEASRPWSCPHRSFKICPIAFA